MRLPTFCDCLTCIVWAKLPTCFMASAYRLRSMKKQTILSKHIWASKGQSSTFFKGLWRLWRNFSIRLRRSRSWSSPSRTMLGTTLWSSYVQSSASRYLRRLSGTIAKVYHFFIPILGMIGSSRRTGTLRRSGLKVEGSNARVCTLKRLVTCTRSLRLLEMTSCCMFMKDGRLAKTPKRTAKQCRGLWSREDVPRTLGRISSDFWMLFIMLKG